MIMDAKDLEMEVWSAIENNGIRIENLQEDVVRLGLIICGLLVLGLILGGVALYHFW